VTLVYFLSEYEPSVPEVSKDDSQLIFLSSDSEEDSSHDGVNYFDLSSSSSDSDDDDEDYFDKLARPLSETEYLECNRIDDEDDNIIPLEQEDCDFVNVDLDSHGQMCCPICSIVFKVRLTIALLQMESARVNLYVFFFIYFRVKFGTLFTGVVTLP